MIHLSTSQQFELRKALMRVRAFASNNPETTQLNVPKGPVMGPQLDLFVDDLLTILGIPKACEGKQ